MIMDASYEPLKQQASSSLSEIKMQIVEESDFSVTFGVFNGWTVLIDGDPITRPAFNLFIISPERPAPARFNVRILMRVFGNGVIKPSFSNQLKFVIENKESLFVPNPEYAPAYMAEDT